MVKKNNKPYKYNSKSRLTSTNSFPFNSNSVKKLNESKKNLENTLTKFHVIEDNPKDKDALDNSFLEGRGLKKENKKKHRQVFKNSISFWKNFFLITSLVCAVILALLFMINTIRQLDFPKKEVVEKKMDDNYLFVGDYYTDSFPFKELGVDFHFVKSGNSNLTTLQLINNMKKYVYDYNPSMVFIEVGNVDIKEGIHPLEIINNYREIIKLIKNNRPNASIYVESLYPGDSNNISNVNKMLKELCIEENIYYFDVYSLLNDNSYYLDDKKTLSFYGYQELFKKIKSIIG